MIYYALKEEVLVSLQIITDTLPSDRNNVSQFSLYTSYEHLSHVNRFCVLYCHFMLLACSNLHEYAFDP